MTEPLHSRHHPEPEVLSAFVEGVLPEHERLDCLAHFADCSDCRQIVFLAQPLEQETIPAQAAASASSWRMWRRWFRPIPMLSAALAVCVLMVALFVYRQPTPVRTPPTEIADVKAELRDMPPPAQSTSEPERKAAVPSAKRNPRTNGAGSKAAGLVKQPEMSANDSVSGAIESAPKLDAGLRAAPPAPQAALPPQSSLLPQSAPAIAPEPHPARALPLSGRDAKALDALAKKKANAAGIASMLRAPRPAGPAAGSAFAVNIQHERNPVNSLSAVKGSVTDLTGDAIQGATVTIHQLAGGTTGATVTNAKGEFAIEALPVGTYELQITSPGFQGSSAQVELQPQDLALVSTALQVGLSAQTVEVTAANPMVQSSEAKVFSRVATRLPSKLPTLLTAANGKFSLAMDSAGSLFFSRNAGKHWKAVKPQWPGKVAQVVVSAEPAPFQLTTDTASIWVSQDGVHWHPAPQGPGAAHQ